MALPKVQIVQSPNGLGRPLEGSDYVSGLLFYSNTLPSGFDSSNRIKTVFSLAEAEALGITDLSVGATASTATVTITNKGAVGDTGLLTVLGTTGLVTLASYTQVTADVVSTTTSAAALAAAINAGTATHGYTASPAVAVVTITAPLSEGLFLNTGTPYVFTPTGTLAATVVQNVVTGVGSIIDVLHYHVAEYFRIQPKGKLYIGIYAEESTTYTFAALTTLINFAAGEIRQIGIYQKNVAYVNSQTTVIQALLTASEAVYKPCQVLLQAEISGTANVSSLTTLTGLSNPNVSVVIAQDGANVGYLTYLALGKSVGAVGTALGAVSLAAVNESIAWVSKFNMATTEYDTIAFANGQLYSALADSLFETLNTYHYIFLLKHIDIDGSYWNDSPTCIANTSDYSKIELNRVYHKISRNVRVQMLPSLSSPILVNADGTLTPGVIGFFETLANRAVEAMEAAGEISAHKVIINPSQNVLSTSTLEVTLQNVPTGVARIIKVNVGFVTSI